MLNLSDLQGHSVHRLTSSLRVREKNMGRNPTSRHTSAIAELNQREQEMVWRLGRSSASRFVSGGGVAAAGSEAGVREPRGASRLPHREPVQPSGLPWYYQPSPQPIRSLSKPANMHASCVICSGRSSEGVSMSNERWIAEKMQSE